jgi:hypothetical protein
LGEEPSENLQLVTELEADPEVIAGMADAGDGAGGAAA